MTEERAAGQRYCARRLGGAAAGGRLVEPVRLQRVGDGLGADAVRGAPEQALLRRVAVVEQRAGAQVRTAALGEHHARDRFLGVEEAAGGIGAAHDVFLAAVAFADLGAQLGQRAFAGDGAGIEVRDLRDGEAEVLRALALRQHDFHCGFVAHQHRRPAGLLADEGAAALLEHASIVAAEAQGDAGGIAAAVALQRQAGAHRDCGFGGDLEACGDAAVALALPAQPRQRNPAIRHVAGKADFERLAALDLIDATRFERAGVGQCGRAQRNQRGRGGFAGGECGGAHGFCHRRFADEGFVHFDHRCGGLGEGYGEQR